MALMQSDNPLEPGQALRRILSEGLASRPSPLIEGSAAPEQEQSAAAATATSSFRDFLSRGLRKSSWDKSEIEKQVREEAVRQGLNPELAVAVAAQESGLNPFAVSRKGAIGVMQLMPSTAAELGVDPRDPLQNIRGGVKLLKSLVDKYGNYSMALAAYNAGESAVEKHGGIPPYEETQKYVPSVLARMAGAQAVPPQQQGDRELGQLLLRRFLGETAPTAGAPARPAGVPLAGRGEPISEWRQGQTTRQQKLFDIPPSEQEYSSDFWKKGKIEKARELAETSLLKTATGKSAMDLYDSLYRVVPDYMRGRYLAEVAREVARIAPGTIDFLTSPLGIGLVAASLFPSTAPFAIGIGAVLVGQQALSAIPDIANAISDPSDPRKVGRAIASLAGTYLGAKGVKAQIRAVTKLPTTASSGQMLREYIKNLARPQKGPAELGASRGKQLRQLLEEQPDLEGKLRVIREAQTPTTIREAAERSLWLGKAARGTGISGITKIALGPARKPPLLDLAQELVDARSASLAIAENMRERVLQRIESQLTPEQRHVTRLGYAIEDPSLRASLSPKEQAAVTDLTNLTRQFDKELRRVYGDAVSLLDPETYLSHFWDMTKISGELRPAVVEAFGKIMRDPKLTHARVIPTYKHGMEIGIQVGGQTVLLKPLFTDVVDIMRARLDLAAKAAYNLEFAKTLKKLGLMLSEGEAKRMGVLDSWERVPQATALYQATYMGTTQRGQPLFRYAPPRVPADIRPAVEAIFGQPYTGPGWAALEALTAYTKMIKVGLSMFHAVAIAEVVAGVEVGLRRPMAALKAAIPIFDPEFVRGIRAGTYEVLGKPVPQKDLPPMLRLREEMVRDALASNMDLNTMERTHRAVVTAQNLWKDRGPLLRALGLPVRALGNMQYVLNKALFDYYMPGHMLLAWERIKLDALRRNPNMSPSELADLKKQAADHINRAFGVENLERMLLTPVGRQLLSAALFAPMWTISNTRVLTHGFRSAAGAKMSTRYIAGAGLVFLIGAELLNYAISSWYDMPYQDADGTIKKGGHWTWQNPGAPLVIDGEPIPGVSENVFNIAFGYNPDGTERYLRPSKAYREPYGWVSAPFKTLGGKLSMPLRMALVLLTKVEPGSGFRTIDPNLPKEDQFLQAVAEVAGLALPFSMAGIEDRIKRMISKRAFREPTLETAGWLGLPVRKGLTVYSAAEALEQAIRLNRKDLAQQVMWAAQANHLDIRAVISALRSRVRATQRIVVGPRIETEDGSLRYMGHPTEPVEMAEPVGGAKEEQ